MTLKINPLACDLANNASFKTYIGNAAPCKLFGGTQPAAGGAETTLLVSYPAMGTPYAPDSSGGSFTPTAPAPVNPTAAGVVTWGRQYKADGTTWAHDFNVGDLASLAWGKMNSTTTVMGVPVTFTPGSITHGNV